jgi:hypothetical protein
VNYELMCVLGLFGFVIIATIIAVLSYRQGFRAAIMHYSIRRP